MKRHMAQMQKRSEKQLELLERMWHGDEQDGRERRVSRRRTVREVLHQMELQDSL